MGLSLWSSENPLGGRGERRSLDPSTPGTFSGISSTSLFVDGLPGGTRICRWWSCENNASGMEIIRGSRAPLEVMLGVPRVRESENEYCASICCKARSKPWR